VVKGTLRKQLRRLRISNVAASNREEIPSPSDRALRTIMADIEERRRLHERLEAALAEQQSIPRPVPNGTRWAEMDRREKSIQEAERALAQREEALRAHLESYERRRGEISDEKILAELRKLDVKLANLSPSSPKPRPEVTPQGPASSVKQEPEAEGDEGTPPRTLTAHDGTGVSRLDDLLGGGIPIGSNVMVIGPRHSGPDVLGRFLAAEGLRRSIPMVWVLTDQDMDSIQEGMTAILDNYREYERKGLVKYVDLYSTRIGSAELHENVWHISVTESDALEKLEHVVGEIAADFAKSGTHFHLVFQSISTLTASLDSQAILKFLLPFTGRRHREGAVSYYVVDPGISQPGEIELLEHMMSGSLNLKKEGEKFFLSAQGIADEVRSRGWIQYTFTRSRFQLGSFSLTHIR
jgi:KaiC/GvpD/RAD55 family RecA-like ATPase